MLVASHSNENNIYLRLKIPFPFVYYGFFGSFKNLNLGFDTTCYANETFNANILV